MKGEVESTNRGHVQRAISHLDLLHTHTLHLSLYRHYTPLLCLADSLAADLSGKALILQILKSFPYFKHERYTLYKKTKFQLKLS